MTGNNTGKIIEMQKNAKVELLNKFKEAFFS